MRWRRFAGGLILLALGAGCHRHRAGASTPTKNARPPHAPAPIGRPLAGSTVALARIDGKRIAFVSDSDTGSIRRIDLDERAELEPIALKATPGPLLVLDDGRLLTVTREDAKLVAIGGFAGLDDPGTDRAWMSVPAEPVGLAISPDGAATYVTSGWGHALVGFRSSDFERAFELDLPREPRAVAVSDDGGRVFVTHAVGSHLTVVDVAGGHVESKRVALRGEDTSALEAADEDAPAKKRARHERLTDGLPTCQSFGLAKSAAVPGRVFVPEVLVDPGPIERRSTGYGSSNGRAAEVASVAVIDASTTRPVRASMRRVDPQDDDRPPCLLPRAATIDDPSRTLLVACQGIDALVAYDAMSATPGQAELRRWPVGAGPTGVAVDAVARQAVVWSQFDRTVTVVSLDDGPRSTPVARIATGPAGLESSLMLGRVLFHRTADRRISGDGRACASCHPDGRDDGLVWSTPEGPRRSIMLAGRLIDTAPFSWQGNAPTLKKHLAGTFQRLDGTGLEGAELEALVGYVRSLPARAAGGVDDEPSVRAGAKIFASTRTGCSGCHSGPTFTDGAMHDVGSGRAFNTPSLVNVGSGGPWFHDGRYATLGDLIRRSDGKMGHTKHLSSSELSQLVSFLGSL